ncbi:SGNH/GDSL hydrolase family protein [Psychroflexus planctonicus]|uniref:Outer membrane protein n=1 Tax=Psychroflexus planctonicus TaxID=1526575 RepID=A0ABQ1SIZ3_9FLAO|nr:SGNH/GDSL hydrolase family protein [Psychroflexus planctonicus]GGE38699.1 outer membrane protein [Psychroflexus planctonicus]
MKKYIFLSAIASLAFISCEPEFDNSIEEGDFYSAGDADFSNFVSVGNSLTAGYADNALYREGQMNSFPNIMAGQFEFVGGGEFRQPLMEDNLGGLKLNGNVIQGNRLVLAFNENGTPGPQPLAGDPQTDITNQLSGMFNNMGAPGAKSFHLLAPGYGNVAGVAQGTANPYYARFASSAEATIIEDAVAQQPTFFSFWIGNNDILGYATSGGTGVNQQGNFDPSTYAGNDITDINVFASVYNDALSAMVENASGGVVFNVPNVTNIPFFTTVPPNPVPLDQPTAAGLAQLFGAYNTQILPAMQGFGIISEDEAAARLVNFQPGEGNFVTIRDENLTNISSFLQNPPLSLPEDLANIFGQLRQATPDDLITLTASGVIGNPVGQLEFMGMQVPLINGVTVPLEDQFVLTPQEQNTITQAQTAYNSTIEALANQNNLAFVDVDMILRQVSETGIPFNGGVLTAEFATGGAFSLDGVHLTPRGYALVANRALQAINQTYNADIPQVDVGNYRSIQPSNNVD